MKYELFESCIFSEYESGSLILNIETGKYLELNSVATEIIKGVKEDLTIDEIINKLDDRYEESKDEISNQVLSFISTAEKQKIISKKS